MTDRFRNRLSEYLDGELSRDEASLVERHLDECEDCAATLEGLRRVVARAGELEPHRAPDDLWSGVATRIANDAPGRETERAPNAVPLGRHLRERHFSFSLPQLAAAAVLLVTTSAGTVWLLEDEGAAPGPRPVASVAEAESPSASGDAGLVSSSEPDGSAAAYARAISELQAALFYGESALDSLTVLKLKASLDRIDEAIEEAQRALELDSADPYVRQHLAEAQRRKVRFLRYAATVMEPRT